jgi:hypothetical protein
MLGLINYRNLKMAQLQLYKISATQYNLLAAMRGANTYNDGNTIFASDSVLNYLKKLKAIREENINLPDPQDYKQHSTEFKIDPLKSGFYVLVMRDPGTVDPLMIQLTSFKVSHLAFVTRREPDGNVAIRVSDRESGKPLVGVHVIMAEKDENKATDNNGACNLGVSGREFSIKVTTNTDTLYVAHRYASGPQLNDPNAINKRTILFTDREIYRPGQTVFYKGICLQTHDGKSIIMPGQKLTVTIKDNNQKAINVNPVVANDYGTFAGSFTIPQNVLNGAATITTDNSGYKYIRVEEYKRPNFQVVMDPVTESYKPNDSVTVKGTVKAYSGYGLSAARVVYHLTRQATLNDFRLYVKYGPRLYTLSQVRTDTIKTDSRGHFEIKFKAAPGAGDNLHDMRLNFGINADVTDGSGETRSANIQVPVSLNNLTIAAYLPSKIIARNVPKVKFNINNLSFIKQKGEVKISLYAVTEPGVLFKNRAWQPADQHLLDSVTFKKYFPSFAYKNEALQSTWPVKNKVAELSAATDEKMDASIDLAELKNQPSGTYRVVISAKSAKGDTTSRTQYLQWINEPVKPATVVDWVTLVSDPATDTKTMDFFVGTGVKGYVLMEKYNGAALLSSQWFTVPDGKQKLVQVPIAESEKDVNVQFLTFSQNQVYNHYQQAPQKQADKLDIKFITFRDKLQPGEKEQWKLQISSNNKEVQAAEMVADLYDASLDALGGNYNTWNNLLNYQYRPNYFMWDA